MKEITTSFIHTLRSNEAEHEKRAMILSRKHTWSSGNCRTLHKFWKIGSMSVKNFEPGRYPRF